MQALQFDFKLQKYALTKMLGRIFPTIYWNPAFSCVQLSKIEEPSLPNEEWVKMKVKYGGICGSDMNLIFLNDSPATSPYASFPFTIGHEAVGIITEIGTKVEGLSIGDRIVIDPVLSCVRRGITPVCPACAEGNESLCHKKTAGEISPGLLIGACKDTGGSWGNYLVAHKSQVIKLPDEVDDKNGVLVEPFSCALHAVLRNKPRQGDTVLIIGAGVIGLSVVAALRALDITCNIIVLAKHSYQGEMAYELGANQVIYLSRGTDYLHETASALSANVLKPVYGPPVIQGGANVVYECVGKKKSVNDALNLAESGGRVVLLGLAGLLEQVDWTTVWLNELNIKGCFAYSTNEFEGKKRNTLDIAIEIMKRKKVDLSPLITHEFPLNHYKEAFRLVTSRNRNTVMKVVFDHDNHSIGG